MPVRTDCQPAYADLQRQYFPTREELDEWYRRAELIEPEDAADVVA